MVPGTAHVAGDAERAAEAEVGEVVHRMGLDDCLELGRRLLELAVAEGGASERLANGALLGRLSGRLGERLGGRPPTAVLEPPDTPPGRGGERLRVRAFRPGPPPPVWA